MKDLAKRKQILDMRLTGMTLRQIAEKIGLSRQRVGALLSPSPGRRRVIIRKAQGKCQKCGILVGRSGHVHHKLNCPGDDYNDYDNLQLLCPSCHKIEHLRLEFEREGRNRLTDSMEQDLRDIKRAIPRELWREARAQAIRQGMPIKYWLIEAIKEKLEKLDKEGRK